MRTVNLLVKVEASTDLEDEDVRVLLDTLINAGLGDARDTVEDAGNDASAFDLGTMGTRAVFALTLKIQSPKILPEAQAVNGS